MTSGTKLGFLNPTRTQLLTTLERENLTGENRRKDKGWNIPTLLLLLVRTIAANSRITTVTRELQYH
jgi:hypothetical protein